MTRRVHVTGGQGSGKSTLARRLGALLDAPVYELDLVGWEAGTGRERPLEETLARVREIAAQPRWVTEGTMPGWSDPLLRAADRIVWLDIPWGVALWRRIAQEEAFPGRRRPLRRGLAPRLPPSVRGRASCQCHLNSLDVILPRPAPRW